MSEYPRPYVVISDKSREKDSFGQGVIEERQTVAPEPASARRPTPVPISIPSAPVAFDSRLLTSSDLPPSYATHPGDDSIVSPCSDSSSNPSHESSPLSPGPKMPSDEDSSVPSTLRGRPVHIGIINQPPFGHQNEA